MTKNMRQLGILIFFLSIFSTESIFAYQYDLAVSAIFRNEGPYLKEWVEFHKLVGVQHFYLYNHCSEDNYAEVLAPYIERGEVELLNVGQGLTRPNIIEWNLLQGSSYTQALRKATGVCKWVAFLDIDEFLFPTEPIGLVEVLREYEGYGGVGVNWLMFGTSGVEKISPNDLLIERLTRCAPLDYSTNLHIKSIIRPEFVAEIKNPHFANYYPGFFQVNTDHLPYSGPFSPYVQVNKLRINHYWTRDEDYFCRFKVPRRTQWGWGEGVYDMHKILNLHKDTHILYYLETLREAMQLPSESEKNL